MVSKSFSVVMTSTWGWPKECPLFSLQILTHWCHGFPCMRIQFSNSVTVLMFMKDPSALSKNSLFRLDDGKAHLHLHCFISLLSLIWHYLRQIFYNLTDLYLMWFFLYKYWCILWYVCIYVANGNIQVRIWVFAFDSTCRGQYLTLGCLSQSSKICYYYYYY